MKTFITVIALGVVLGSCSSSTKLAENSSEFKKEYQKTLAEYNSRVDPQIYNNYNGPILTQERILLTPSATLVK